METFDFDNVVLVPKKCVVNSRAESDVTAKLGKKTFKIPLMPSNMPAIMDEKLAVEFAKRNYFYVMHRNHIDIVAFCKKMKAFSLFISISLGITQQSHDILDELMKLKIVPEYINVDIAHGHSETVKGMIEHIRQNFGSSTFIIAGNVGTPEAFSELESWGADAINVGIGPGYICSTTIRTGFGTRGWQLSAVEACAKVAKTAVVIADGGARTSGDISKAIHFGAHWVRSGYFFAGHKESPTKEVEKDGLTLKEYYGNASQQCTKKKSRTEGITVLVPAKESIFDTLIEIEEDLQSAVSYAGGRKLYDIKNAEHVFIK